MLQPTELAAPMRSFAGLTTASERSEQPVVLGYRLQSSMPQSQWVLSFAAEGLSWIEQSGRKSSCPGIKGEGSAHFAEFKNTDGFQPPFFPRCLLLPKWFPAFVYTLSVRARAGSMNGECQRVTLIWVWRK